MPSATTLWASMRALDGEIMDRLSPPLVRVASDVSVDMAAVLFRLLAHVHEVASLFAFVRESCGGDSSKMLCTSSDGTRGFQPSLLDALGSAKDSIVASQQLIATNSTIFVSLAEMCGDLASTSQRLQTRLEVDHVGNGLL